MKQGIPSRRTRGRGNNTRGRQQSNIRNQQMDSNGPAGRLRGTPQQILDRYSALARDASSAGDTVLAENLWQHAEHYTRMLSAAQQQQQPNQQPNQQQQGGNGQRYGNGNGRDDQYDYDDQDDDSSGSHDSGNGSDDRGNYDRGNYDRNNDSRNNDDRGSGQQRRDTPIEPLVLKSDPVPASEAQSAEAQAKADPAESEQPEAPAVWTKEDAQKATEEAAGEERPAPRRRRRTRFPRQADGSEGGSASESSGKNEDGKTRTDKGKSASNGEGKDTDSQSRDDQSGGEGQAASPTQLTLPEDPSPAALVELLTREEESKPRRKRAAGDDSDS